MKAVRRSESGRTGAAAVETAFVLLITLFLIFGIIEYCRYLLAIQLCSNAAREGLRDALVASWITDNDPKISGANTYVDFNNTTDTNTNCASIQTLALNRMAGIDKAFFTVPGSNPVTRGVTTSLYLSDKTGATNLGGWESAGSASGTAIDYPLYITFSLSGNYQPILPIFPSVLPVNILAVAIVENND